jgi:serine/threonine-protein kinase
MERGYRSGTVLLDKYRVESVVGRGGMAIVLRATHLHLGEEVALKILLTDSASPDVHARFLREAQAVVRLRGEHVTRVLDVGRLVDNTPYMVMEFLRGTDLSGEIRRRGAFAPPDAVDCVLQACEALAEAHSHGIIHRDIKPSNLFLTMRPDGTPLLKVLDFGISKTPVGGSPLTQTDTVMGTAGYMSPEQMKAAREVDGRTDIWSLGVVLYELLSGRPPFYAEAFSAVVLMAATEPPPALDPRLPRGLEAIVLRCLAKDRNGRFGSMAELAVALAPYARDQRAATVVVDRTRLMLGGPPAPVTAPSLPAHHEAATTLQSTAGSRILAAARTPRRRALYTVAGAVALVAMIAAMVAVGLSGTRGTGLGSGIASGAPQITDSPPSTAAGHRPESPTLPPAPSVATAVAPAVAPEPAAAPPAAQVPAPVPASVAPAPAAEPSAVTPRPRAEPPEQPTEKQTRDRLDASRKKPDPRRSDKLLPPQAAAVVPPAAAPKSAGSDDAAATRSTNPCDPDNVDALIAQAHSQSDAGSDRAALGLITKALACRQDVSMYRSAATYACGAHDLASARRYHAKLSLQDQASVEDRCAAEGIQIVQ